MGIHGRNAKLEGRVTPRRDTTVVCRRDIDILFSAYRSIRILLAISILRKGKKSRKDHQFRQSSLRVYEFDIKSTNNSVLMGHEAGLGR